MYYCTFVVAISLYRRLNAVHNFKFDVIILHDIILYNRPFTIRSAAQIVFILTEEGGKLRNLSVGIHPHSRYNNHETHELTI